MSTYTHDQIVELCHWMADHGYEVLEVAEAVEKPHKYWPDYVESDEYAETHTPEPEVEDGEPRYPDIHVQLTGTDGNAGTIMGTVARALQRAGVPKDEVDEYRMESMSGDYSNLLATAMRWVSVT